MAWLLASFMLWSLTPRDLSSGSGVLGVLYSSPNMVRLQTELGDEWSVSLSPGTPSQLVIRESSVWVFDPSQYLLTEYDFDGIPLQSYAVPLTVGQARDLKVWNQHLTLLGRDGRVWQLVDGEWTFTLLQDLENPLGFTPLSHDTLLVLDRVQSGFFGMKMVLKTYQSDGSLVASYDLPSSLYYGVDLYPVTDSGPYLILDAFTPKVMRVSPQGDSLGAFELPTSGGIAISGPWQEKLWVMTLNTLQPIPIAEPTMVTETPVIPSHPSLRIQTAPGKLILSWTEGEVQIFDILGRRLLQSRSSASRNMQLSVKPGIYFVRYHGPREKFVKKILVFPKGG